MPITDVDVIFDILGPKQDLGTKNLAEDTIHEALLKALAKTQPKPHIFGKSHCSYCTAEAGDEARVLQREGTELEQTRRVSIVDEEMR